MGENEFGARLKLFRQENFLTQEQMAELLGLSPNHIGSLERGVKKPRASTIASFEELKRRNGREKRCELERAELMNGREMELYSELWRCMSRMEAERRREFVRMLERMLDWM